MIIHVDMDAFYASVEQRDRPELVGKPVIVGGTSTGRGVVCAASYEAREFGVRSAMPTSQAVKLCPGGIFIKPRMHHYAAISRTIRSIFERYTSLIEPISLDEAFLDVTGSLRLFGTAEDIARKIKFDIKNETRLNASAGIAPNKYLAKLASDLDKPDGFVIVPTDDIQRFLDPLAISRVWGVGKQCLKKFNEIGAKTIGDLRKIPVESLKQIFGINGEHFFDLARGIDNRKVVPDRDAKSISHESTFHTDIVDRETLEAWLIYLLEMVCRRMRSYQIFGRTVQLKIRFSDFRTITRAATLSQPTNTTREIKKTATSLLCQNLEQNGTPVRLLGVGVTNLEKEALRQTLLFDEVEHQRDQRLDDSIDRIRERFGNDSVKSGKVIDQKIEHRPAPNVDPDLNG